MENNIQDIVTFLKKLIYKNGEDYLNKETYDVYKKLIESKIVDKEIAASIMHLLLCISLKDISNNEKDEISKRIQKECFFNKKISDYLSEIIISLYSKDNKNELKNNELVGFKLFLSENFIYEWVGFSVWDVDGVTVDCDYNATITLKPTKKIMDNKEFSSLLNKNKFLTKEAIEDYFGNSLKKYLDNEFEEYCTCDDYYAPVAEDYSQNIDSDIKSWCEKNGFEYVSCEGEGETGGYESKRQGYYHGWY